MRLADHRKDGDTRRRLRCLFDGNIREDVSMESCLADRRIASKLMLSSAVEEESDSGTTTMTLELLSRKPFRHSCEAMGRTGGGTLVMENHRNPQRREVDRKGELSDVDRAREIWGRGSSPR